MIGPVIYAPRVQVIGHDHKTIGTSRDLAAPAKNEQMKTGPARTIRPGAQGVRQWERTGITAHGDLPGRITITENGPVRPGLSVEKDSVNLRLFRSEELCRRASLGGIQKLAGTGVVHFRMVAMHATCHGLTPSL